jgi:hypothetical protein
MGAALDSIATRFAAVGAVYDPYDKMNCTLSLLSRERAAQLRESGKDQEQVSLWDYPDVCASLSDDNRYLELFRQWADALDEMSRNGNITEDELYRSEDRFVIGIAQVLHLWCIESSKLKDATAVAILLEDTIEVAKERLQGARDSGLLPGK